MNSSALLGDIKDSLRVSGDDLNIEIKDLIDAAITDLHLSGVSNIKLESNDFLIKRAITVYCKAHFGYEDPKYADRFAQSYDSLKQHLTLSSEYTMEGDVSG